MLQSLTIRNYALISSLEAEFGSGFSVITGETGAGKSIILGALSLILGARADAKLIRQGEDKCLIEGVFNISKYSLEPFFRERDLEYDSQICIIRREIWTSGKSRAFINDSPASLGDLRGLGSFLIDIHSQHQNLLLSDTQFQLQAIDVIAQNQSIKNRYIEVFKKYVSLNKYVSELKENIAGKKGEEDYILFQLNQLKEAQLQANEQTALEEEQETLSHIEEIKSSLFRIGKTLSDDGSGTVSILKEMLSSAQNIRNIYPDAEEIADRLQSAYLDLKDLARDVESRQEFLEHNPERLQVISSRLDLIYSLQQKHRLDTVEALISLRDNLSAQIGEIDNLEETLEKLEKETKAICVEVKNLAKQLTDTRLNAAQILEKRLVEQVSAIGMSAMRFSVAISAKQQPDVTGADDVTFMFSAGRGGELRPVATTASGGETSRLMLGIKALIAGVTSLPAIIFDEIDTGVSGEIADKMGDILREMGQKMQVIAISHLPQIAAKGDAQYLVYKEEDKTTTETSLRRLNKDERVHEIARILSGADLTEAAIENAKSLLKCFAFIILTVASFFTLSANAQDTVKTDSTVTVPHQEVQAFKPDANKSMLFSAVFPGLGQIYNRKYWKLPLVYGSFLGCTYAILWNQTQFTGYRQAYRDFIDDDINTVSWKNYISPALGYSDNTSEWKDSDVSWFQNTLKRKRDYYNHYRDMSILVSIGIYAVWIVDAYVDAQLFDFDIGPDLSMKIEPAIFEKTNISSRMFGLQLSMIF